MAYKNTNLTVGQIGRELGVDFVLEGSVRREGDRVRVTAQLASVGDQTHVWAESYDREWSVDGLLAIQADIAERVAGSLRLTLSRAEERSLAEAPTRIPEAYDYYLESIEAFDVGYEAEYTLISIERARKAVELDPDFAEAWAMLAHGHLYMYWDANDRTQARLDMARDAG